MSLGNNHKDQEAQEKTEINISLVSVLGQIAKLIQKDSMPKAATRRP